MKKDTAKLAKLLKSKSGIRLDIVHDLETFPWPLPNECVSVAVCKHVIEHINPAKGTFLKFMDEAWRVMKYDAQIAIVVPYAGSPGYWQDPTHINPCNETTWSYFDPLDNLTQNWLYKIYQPKPWEVEMRTWHITGNMEVVMKKRRDDKSFHV